MIGGYGIEQVEQISECKVYPEEELQRCRKNLESLNKAKSILLELADLPVHINFGGHNKSPYFTALGNVEADMYTENKRIERWLNEIDKG